MDDQNKPSIPASSQYQPVSPVPGPMTETTTTTTSTPTTSTTSTTTTQPVPTEVIWPEKKNKSKLPRILAGIAAIVLVAGVAVGAYFVSQKASSREAVAPTAPVSIPMASEGAQCPPKYVSNGKCEGGGIALTIANCCTKLPALSCPAGYVSNGSCESGKVAYSVTNCCILATAASPTPTGTPTPTLTGTPTSSPTSAPSECTNSTCTMYFYNTQTSSCQGTTAHSSLSSCAGNLSLTWPDKFGGTCYGSLSSCQQANPGGGTGGGNTCSVKYYFAVSIDENANGTNKGVCKTATGTYDSAMKSCSDTSKSCSDILKETLTPELQGTATCYNNKASCDNAGGNTGFRFYFNAALNKCASTNHRYTPADMDVDGTGQSCSKNIEQWDNIPGPGVCYKTMLACTTAQCTATTWTPAANTVCVGTNLTQTSNCNTTRTVAGTKVCTSGAPNITLEKKAYQDESSNVAGTYSMVHEINTVSKDQVYVYVFKVNNSGTAKAENVEVTDTLKGDNQELLTLVDAESRCTYSTSTRILKCSGMSLAAGASGTYSFRVQVSSGATNGETIKDTGNLTYKDMPANTNINASAEVIISTVVGCNNVCTGDSECVDGLSCDTSSGKCRNATCADSSSCNCPVVRATIAPTARPTAIAQRPQPTVLPETGILDLPGVAAFGGGLLLAVVGILLAL